MTMKLSPRLICFLLLAIAFPVAAAVPTNWSAKVEASDGALRGFGFPGHIIAVKFPKPFPVSIVRQVANYSLFRSDAPQKPIEIHRVRSGANLHGGDPEVEASQVLLLPVKDLEPPGKNKYFVQVQFGNQSSRDIEAVWPEDEGEGPPQAGPPSDNGLINLITLTTNFLFGPLSAQVDMRSPFEGNHAPVFDFKVNYDLPSGPLFLGRARTNYSSMWIGGMNLAADGTYKINTRDTNIADHLSASLNFDLLRLYRLCDPLTARDADGQYQGKLAYYAGFRLTGFELEADQDFDVVNWSIQPQLALWVPYSNLPGLWWVRQMGVRRNAATPLFVYGGYSVVDSLRTKNSEVPRDLQEADRFELELAYAFPLTSRIRLGLRSRHFWLQQGQGQRNYQELFARYYLTDSTTASILFKYTRGALPPKFEKGETAAAGITLEF